MTQTAAYTGQDDESGTERKLYPRSYKTKGVERQLEILASHAPGIDIEPALHIGLRVEQQPLRYAWLEASFAVIDPLFFGSYADALDWALDALIDSRARNRTSVNDRLRQVYLAGRNLADCVRLTDRTEHFHAVLRHKQPGDVWIVNGQFGWHHRVRSIVEVRERYAEDEYGFGLYEVCCMLLTHRRRLMNGKAHQIECPGDEFMPRGRDQFSDAAFMQVHDGQLCVDAFLADITTRRIGSVTGIIPNL